MSATDERNATDGLLSASEVAQLARVTPSAVSNWRKRFSDFPAPAGTAPSGGDLFRRADVERWLRKHRPGRKRVGGDATEQLWVVADRLRGRALAGDLVGAVAAAAVLLHLARTGAQAPIFHELHPEATVIWARETTNRLAADRAELQGLFTPIFLIDPESLRLLLDTLAEFEDAEELAAAVDVILDRGLRYGEYRTPEPVARLLAALAEPRGVVFDPAVGSAGFLIEAARIATAPVAMYGQEINESGWRTALARLLLRDLDADIALGDSIREDRFLDLRADVVMCEPPAGARMADLQSLAGDERWEVLGSYEAPPPRASDFIWLAHVLKHLAPEGRGYVLLPRGSLLRKGIEARFRTELLRRGMVETVVALPGGSLAGTAVSPVLWIVRPPTRTPDDVLVIDASDGPGITAKLQRRLVQTLRDWRHKRSEFEPAAGFATGVPVLELLAGDAVLSPGRWLYEPELVDPHTLIAQVEQAQAALETVRIQTTPPPPYPTLVPADGPPTRVRVGELVESGLAQLLRPARIKTEQFGDEGLPVWLPADVREPWRRPEEPRFVDPALVDERSITAPGDIVFTTVGGLRTRVDDEGGHVLGTSLQALRLNHDLFDAYVVAALLTSEHNRRLLTGTTIPRVDVLELEVPRLDPGTAARAAKLMRALEDELVWAHAVVEHAEHLRTTVVDAMATGAAELADPADTEDDVT